jgi:hypothetical protein
VLLSDIQQLRIDISSIAGAKTVDGLQVLQARSVDVVVCTVCPKMDGDCFSIVRSLARPGGFIRAIEEHCAGKTHTTKLALLAEAAPARSRLSFAALSMPASFIPASSTPVTVVCSGFKPAEWLTIPVSFSVTVEDLSTASSGGKTTVTVNADPYLLLGNTFWPASRTWAADAFHGSFRHR